MKDKKDRALHMIGNAYIDPVYRNELKMTGQVRGLNYLKKCRGGDFVPNPE